MCVFHGHINASIILYPSYSCQLIFLVFLPRAMYNSKVLVIESEEKYPL